jgi:hypothetical protein
MLFISIKIEIFYSVVYIIFCVLLHILMALLEGNVDFSSRITYDEEKTFKKGIRYIHSLIVKYKNEKLQQLSDHISMQYDKMMHASVSRRKKLSIKILNTPKIDIDIVSVQTLPLSHFIDGELMINITESNATPINIVYQCETFEEAIEPILNKLPGKRIDGKIYKIRCKKVASDSKHNTYVLYACSVSFSI